MVLLSMRNRHGYPKSLRNEGSPAAQVNASSRRKLQEGAQCPAALAFRARAAARHEAGAVIGDRDPLPSAYLAKICRRKVGAGARCAIPPPRGALFTLLTLLSTPRDSQRQRDELTWHRPDPPGSHCLIASQQDWIGASSKLRFQDARSAPKLLRLPP